MTTPPDLSVIKAAAGELTAEAVARIIDPSTFELIAHYNGLDPRETPEEAEASTFRAYPKLREGRDAALAKANAILALMSPSTTEVLIARVEAADRENAHLRVMAQKAGCFYGHLKEGGCELGYPGCACMDDLLAMQAWCPEDEDKAAVRLGRRALAAEARVEAAEGERDEARPVCEDKTIVDDLMQLYADPAENSVTYRAAKEILFQWSRAQAAEARVEKALAVLEELQWSAEDDWRNPCCPSCGEKRSSGHSVVCSIREALTPTGGQ